MTDMRKWRFHAINVRNLQLSHVRRSKTVSRARNGQLSGVGRSKTGCGVNGVSDFERWVFEKTKVERWASENLLWGLWLSDFERWAFENCLFRAVGVRNRARCGLLLLRAALVSSAVFSFVSAAVVERSWVGAACVDGGVGRRCTGARAWRLSETVEAVGAAPGVGYGRPLCRQRSALRRGSATGGSRWEAGTWSVFDARCSVLRRGSALGVGCQREVAGCS